MAVLGLLTVKAQNGFHQHDGFYLSMGLGASSGTIDDESEGTKMTFDGGGGVFDFKIGGEIRKNLILHATLTGLSMVGPKVTIPGFGSGKSSNDVNITQSMLGPGLTYYTKGNFFFSGSLGIGNYSRKSEGTNGTETTERGFALQIKLGKEWWVSKNWALGVSGCLQSCNITQKYNGFNEKMGGTMFGLMFNATFN